MLIVTAGLQLTGEWLNFVTMNRLSLILIIFLALGLGSCKSHKATVVRATGKPAAAATAKSSTIKSAAPNVPKNAATQSDFANDKRISGELVKQARTWIGTPYSYGSNAKKKGTDCSGFTMSLFQDVANLKLPRNSAAQCEYCFNVPRNAMQPGDLVFFTSSTRGGKVTHVGLYIGDGKMIHASTSRGVIESGLDEKYYASHYHSAGRVYGITYAATGGKKNKTGDKKDLLLASEGLKSTQVEKPGNGKKTQATNNDNKSNKPSKTNKQDKPKKGGGTDKAKKTEPAGKSGASAVVVAPVAKTTVKPAAEMSLDEFAASQQAKQMTDTVIVEETVIAETVDALEKASAAVDSVKTKAAADSVAAPPPAKEKEKADAPIVVVNGKKVQVTEVERKPEKKPETAPADTVKAEAIKNEVVKAMRFGK